MTQRVTLANVATAAGVSSAVVSLVLRGKDQGRFSAETVSRVKAVSAELGYRVDRRARSLATGTSGLIGVVVPDISNPFYGTLLDGIVTELGEDYQAVIVAAHKDSAVTRRNVASALDLGIDGLLLATTEQFEIGVVPTVVLDQPEVKSDAPHVNIDVESSARILANYLTHLGHRRFAYIQVSHRSDTLAARSTAFTDELPDDAEVEFLSCPIDLEAAASLTVERAFSWYRAGITAVVCATDLQAYGALSAILELGLKVPEEFSVIGGDDLPFSTVSNPPLTTVRIPTGDLGRQAVQRLRELLAGSTSSQVENLPTRLIIRKSTGPARSAAVS